MFVYINQMYYVLGVLNIFYKWFYGLILASISSQLKLFNQG